MVTHFLPYAKQCVTSDDIHEVVKALESEFITRGPLVEEFEKAIANYCDAKYAVAFNSGSTALKAAGYAGKLSSGDRFITSPNTFIATVITGTAFGCNPIFIDIDPSTGNLSLDQLSSNLNLPASRGQTVVLPVHFAGIPVDMKALDRLINNPNTLVIEDAAHAIGSRYPSGEKVGSCTYSQLTIFSFHPAKTITTGEGGMVTTNDPHLYHRLKMYRNNGIEREQEYLIDKAAPWYYEVHDLTGNFNFTEIQAALGLSQLKRLDQIVEKRRQLMTAYREKLRNFSHLKMLTDEYDPHVAFHLCVALIDFNAYKTDRTTVMQKLNEKGIGTQFHYIPIYKHPAISKITGDISEYFPHMESYYKQALSLPLFETLSLENVERVVSALKEVLNEDFFG